MFLNGQAIAAADHEGKRVVDDSFVLLFNAHHEDVDFTLPPGRFGATWTCELRTDDVACDGTEQFRAGDTVTLTSRSTLLLRRVT
jgi:isoamylase